MPTSSGYYYGVWEENPRLWRQFQKQVETQMVGEGVVSTLPKIR